MTALKGTKVKTLVGGYEFSSQHNSVEVQIATTEDDTTVFGSTGQTFKPGLVSMRMMQKGYLQGATAAYFEADMKSKLGTSGVTVAAVFDTDTTAAPVYFIQNAMGAKLAINAPVAGLVTIDGEWANDTATGYRAKRVYDGTISSTGGKTSIDLGSAGSNGGVFVLHVTAITGTATSATVDIESSSNNSTFASEGTATFSAIGAQVVTMSGTVNRYLRINPTSLGGATNFTVIAYAYVDGVTTS